MTRAGLIRMVLCAMLAACSGGSEPAQPVPLGSHVDAGGVVEPMGQERLIIPQMTGRVERVLIEEGDAVTEGQLLAELENAEQRAMLGMADAQLAMRRAELAVLRSGARAEEVRAARAWREESRAMQEQAAAELARRQRMAEQGLLATEMLEQSRAQAASAAASLERADADLDLLLAGARAEEFEAAEAAVAAAEAERQRAEAELEKTRIRAPIDGIVLKRVLNAGETVTALSPEPLAAIGDMRQLMVRVEINELDIARVRPGAEASVRSDAFPGQRFRGEVLRVSQRMGPRRIVSDDPTRRRDAQTMEAMIALDPGAPLPIGLRVDTRIQAENPAVHQHD